MRYLILIIDRLASRIGGLFEFSDDPACIFRLQWARARRSLTLSDGTVVEKGEPVLILHLWNEHILPIGEAGPDMTWASQMYRRLVRSLGTMARWLDGQPERYQVRAVAGVTSVLATTEKESRLMQRLGFDIIPYHSPLGRVGEFFENLYAWLLMWAFNKASVRHHPLRGVRRVEIWISTERLLGRFRKGGGFQRIGNE